MPIRTDIPDTNRQLRFEIYNGAVFRLPATALSKRLVADAVCLLEQQLGSNPRLAQFRLTHNDFVNAIKAVKNNLSSSYFQSLLRCLQQDIGFELSENAFDMLRLRAVPHGAHERSDSAPAYIYHRDTWFANPQAQINWWIPLFEVSEIETFSLFPDHFKSAVANSSSDFQYDDWVANVGFNNSYANPAKAALYPTVIAPEFQAGNALTFSSAPGDIILFSGAHLHRTNENTAEHTRFSVDFRTVNLDDHAAELGAPNVDNLSKGDATRAFVYPHSLINGEQETALTTPVITGLVK